MDLEVFPMDTQECRLLVECYGYTANEIHLQWHVGNKSVDLPENIPLAQFGVIGHFLLNYTLHFSTGSFSDLEVKFLFKRDLLYFILQSYVPSTFIVMCSMVSMKPFFSKKNSSKVEFQGRAITPSFLVCLHLVFCFIVFEFEFEVIM